MYELRELDQPISGPPSTSAKTYVALAAALMGIGLGSQGLSPILLAAVQVSRHLSPTTAGAIQTIELAATALAAYWMAPRFTRISPRKLAIIGAVVAAAFHGLSSLQGNLELLALCRAVAGLGAAICVCVANRVIAGQHEPDRTYAVVTALATIAGSGVIPLLVHVDAATGGWGVYAGQGVWVAVLIPLLCFLPRQTLTPVGGGPTAEQLSPGMLIVTLPIFLFSVFSTGVWAFAGNVGNSAHVTSTQFGLALTIGTVVSVLFAGAASWMGTRYGRLLPLFAGIALTASFSVAFFMIKSPTSYIGSFILVQGFHAFLLPFMFGLCSAIDRTGRLATSASSAILIASAIAPAMVGWLIETTSYAFLSAALVVSYTMSFLTFWLSTRSLARSS